MSEREIIETIGNYRASIEVEDYPEAPDWDGQSHVFRMERGRPVERVHVDGVTDGVQHKDADKIEDAIDAVLSVCRDRCSGVDWDLMERYLRVYFGVVSFDYISPGNSDSTYIAVTTNMLAESWGLAPDDEAAIISAKQTLTSWSQWLDGEVYGWIVEKRTEWVHADGTPGTSETWDTEESCWGCYGDGYATEEAKLALRAFTEVNVDQMGV